MEHHGVVKAGRGGRAAHAYALVALVAFCWGCAGAVAGNDGSAYFADWCNEQGRVCHLFGQNHSTAEIYLDGRWVLVDVSWYFVSRDENGNLLSAADSHDRGPGQRGWALSRQRRMLEIGQMTAEEANLDPEQWEPRRRRWIAQGSDEAMETLATNRRTFFGVINTPLPPAPAAE